MKRSWDCGRDTRAHTHTCSGSHPSRFLGRCRIHIECLTRKKNFFFQVGRSSLWLWGFKGKKKGWGAGEETGVEKLEIRLAAWTACKLALEKGEKGPPFPKPCKLVPKQPLCAWRKLDNPLPTSHEWFYISELALGISLRLSWLVSASGCKERARERGERGST